MSHVFECLSCGATTDPETRPADCPACGGRPEVAFEAGALPDALPDADRTDLWRYADWLPTDGIEPVGLGAGRTPLVDAPALGEQLRGDGEKTSDGGAPDVYLKNETANPTWSWKDRLAAIVITRAAADGADGVATASTGNHASAVAAYASRTGIERTLAFVSPSSEPAHHRQIRAHGGEAVSLTDYGPRTDLLRELSDRGWFVAYDVDGRYTGQPYVYEGYKTIAYELIEQLERAPDVVVVPVGAGDGFYGIWKGFRELFARGVIERTPKMISAESAERHPLAAAAEADAESVGRDDGPEPLSTSTMGATSGDHALGAVLASDGAAYAADREAVEAAIRTCGRDGVFLEPASALATAVLPEALADGAIASEDTVVTIGTGAGIGWPEKTASAVGASPTIEPTLEAVAEAVPFDLG
ncbi:hypothetical protein BRC82_04780 [Halobacteriales archaeon QS_1_67_19]|nr:MAG: hypothetical protein BRC82_04780 [Halobacteriales archaeon QS_1_67_19]